MCVYPSLPSAFITCLAVTEGSLGLNVCEDDVVYKQRVPVACWDAFFSFFSGIDYQPDGILRHFERLFF